eukprot:TRINITY_DN46336_c0_g1_i1.p1 TRINITY_DN46336_c0_g1~~TRINITY_DN46336_c0_g1_i1.p1  ORF type:complete len:236 (-),score=59.36 TRINITY_DN46336_c0_g1_i1:91-798(-)
MVEDAIVRPDKRPEVDVADLQRKAKQAKLELARALQVPVPNDGFEEDNGPEKSQDIDIDSSGKATPAHEEGDEVHEDDSAPPRQEDDDDLSVEEAVKGRWKSAKGECRIFSDSVTHRLTFEEKMPDGVRLHGWLDDRQEEVSEGATACWVATLHVLDQDECPWYGPSFGEEPEALGEVRVELMPGRKLRTSIWIADEDEDWQPHVHFSLRPDDEVDEAAVAAQQAAFRGAFVFGQ